MADKKVDLGFDFGRQMYLDQRNKTLVCFCNRLKVADNSNYNELHGKYSLIQLLMEDFSRGKGKNAVYVYYNLAPKDVRTITHWVASIYPTQAKMPHNNFKLFKVYGDKFTQLELIHNPKMKNPFGITVTNGKADGKNKTPIQVSGKISQWYTCEMFYGMWSEIYDRLKIWEIIHYSVLCKSMEAYTAAALDEYYAQRNQSNGNNVAQNNYSRNNQKNVNGGKRQNNNRQQYRRNNNQNNNNIPAQLPKVDIPELMPPLAPPPISEDDTPFNEMPSYGSGYKR